MADFSPLVFQSRLQAAVVEGILIRRLGATHARQFADQRPELYHRENFPVSCTSKHSYREPSTGLITSGFAQVAHTVSALRRSFSPARRNRKKAMRSQNVLAADKNGQLSTGLGWDQGQRFEAASQNSGGDRESHIQRPGKILVLARNRPVLTSGFPSTARQSNYFHLLGRFRTSVIIRMLWRRLAVLDQPLHVAIAVYRLPVFVRADVPRFKRN